MIGAKIIFFLLVLMSFFKASEVTLHFLQESHYHLYYYLKHLKEFYIYEKKNLLLLFLTIFSFMEKSYSFFFAIIILLLFLYFSFKKKYIIKLKYTKRIIRMEIVSFLIYFFIIFLLRNVLNIIFVTSSLLYLIPVFILLSYFILLPLEAFISRIYEKKAFEKLYSCSPLIIAITGSYGKTTTKNILYELLKDKYIVFKTDKSYNTINGISKNINEKLNLSTEVAIFELGISHKGDMKKLLRLIKPDYVIITEIGCQHLKTMKTIDNIVSEKMSILDNLKKDAVIFLNWDNKYISNYSYDYNLKKVKIGIDKKTDFFATNIKYDISGLEFLIKYKSNSIKAKTKLMGRHNIYNIMLASSLALKLGVSTRKIEKLITTLEFSKNRLEIKNEANFTIIDDSYNANVVGFINALEVLSFYDFLKILVTPGIVEAGEKEKEINYELAKDIIKVVDKVILVNSVASIHILKAFKDLNYQNYIVVNSFFEAKEIYETIEEKCVVLIENDITDIYKKKGIN